MLDWRPLVCVLAALACDGHPAAVPTTPVPSAEPKATEELGQCYKNSLHVLLAANTAGIEGELFRARLRLANIAVADARVVHGIATNRRTGAAVGHAWIEGNGVAVDVTHSADVPDFVGPRERYFELLRIKQEDCQQYSFEAALELLQKYGHCGPWNALPAHVVLGWSPSQKPAARRSGPP
jgi:hypothetical protein